jgi:hypothetical protein
VHGLQAGVVFFYCTCQQAYQLAHWTAHKADCETQQGSKVRKGKVKGN